VPELPEVETIARGLAARVPGRRVEGVTVRRPDVIARPASRRAFRDGMTGRRIREVTRRGKNVLFVLDAGMRLLVNLGMTGRLLLDDAPAARGLGHVAVRFRLDDGRTLLYDDVRRFGRMELFDAQGWAERDARFGLEPLGEEMTPEALHAVTSASRVPIRNLLLDQDRIVGVGNIYASEALHRSRVHPARPASSLTRAETHRLRDEIRAVLQEAIDAGGTTFSDYRNASGEAGAFQFRLRVYGREGEPCAHCGTAIERQVISNRSAFFCPACQPHRRGRRA